MLLIGGPLAGAVLVWLAISMFSSKPTTPPEEAVTEQRAPEPVVEAQPGTQPAVEAQPAIETEPAIEANAASPAAAEPASVDPDPLPPPYVPPSAINEVTPNVPQSALNTISGTVRVSVRVTIDNAGAVVDATAEDPGPSRYFERLAVNASKKWGFSPANTEEQRTKLVKFNFTREGVTAHAEPDEER